MADDKTNQKIRGLEKQLIVGINVAREKHNAFIAGVNGQSLTGLNGQKKPAV